MFERAHMCAFVFVFENPIYNYTDIDIDITEHMLISHSLSSLNNGIGAKVSNTTDVVRFMCT